jgi:hypothetical protein
MDVKKPPYPEDLAASVGYDRRVVIGKVRRNLT